MVEDLHWDATQLALFVISLFNKTFLFVSIDDDELRPLSAQKCKSFPLDADAWRQGNSFRHSVWCRIDGDEVKFKMKNFSRINLCKFAMNRAPSGVDGDDDNYASYCDVSSDEFIDLKLMREIFLSFL